VVAPAACARSPPPKSAFGEMSSTDLNAAISARTLSLCFIGMSNCGKSHWSTQLERELGFRMVSVDEEIEDAIAPELAAAECSGIDGMAQWMGFPSDERFKANEATYLGHEENLTAAAVATAAGAGGDPANFVLDSTGSVIYLSQATLEKMQSRFLVVHLEASDDMLEKMADNYFLTPKPVVWGDCYRQKDGEEPEDALRRSYPELLRTRRARYHALAHVTIPANFALNRDVSLNQLLNRIRASLDAKRAMDAMLQSRAAGA
jgi:shikimate kinase